MSDPTTPTPADDASVPPVPPAPPAPAADAAADAVAEAPDNPYVNTPESVGAANPYVTPTTVPSSAPAAPAAPDAPAAPAAPAVSEPAATAPVPPYVQQPAAAPANPYAAPQNPYTAPQNPYTAQPGYVAPGQAPMYGVAPAAPSRFNVLGLVALIAGGLGLLIGLIPLVGLFGSFLALAGVVMGIIGVLLKTKAKGLAIAGLIVSAVALLLSLAISIFTIIAINNFANESANAWESSWEDEFGDSGATSAPQVGDEPVAVEDSDRDQTGPGSYGEPIALGEEYTFVTDGGTELWAVTVGAANLDATADVRAADDWNDAPPAGHRYVVIPMTVTNLQDSATDPWMDFYYHFATVDGKLYEDEWLWTYPGLLQEIDDVAPGETVEANMVFIVPDDVVDGGVLKLDVWDVNPRYFAIS